MKFVKNTRICVTALAVLCAPAFATVKISYLKPSLASPQKIGTIVDWTAAATDTGAGPLTFQFNVAGPGKSLSVVRDFNVGTQHSSAWTPAPLAWNPAVCSNLAQPDGVVAYTCQPLEGVYEVEVVAKDFGTGESASKTVKFQVTPLVTGSAPVAVATANALVALFSSPSCATGSQMRVSFQEASGATPAMTTNYVKCHPPTTMTFEVAGMYPSTAYNMFSQTLTGGSTVNGPTVSFTTGALPSKVPFPSFKVIVPAGSQTDTTDRVLLHGSVTVGAGTQYAYAATDLGGNLIWYAYPPDLGLTRPLPNGTYIAITNGASWNPASNQAQLLRQMDLAGNILRETNTGIIQQQLLAKGATDGGPCNVIPSPAPVGAACLGHFHHEFIQSLPNGYSVAMANIEKIFPPGTQGDTSGLPVDIVGDMFVVLDTNWQVVWYWDAFEHDSGAPQLDINRPAVLGETCVSGQFGCYPIYLLASGIAPNAYDWLHGNSIYYWPAPQNGTAKGDLIWSSRHQDWVMRVDYQDGTGTGNILWRMGNQGDFTFKNLNNDPWPWFSHQHEVGIENNGNGVMSIFDNGNTRVTQLGRTGCKPHDCNSRGMAVKFDEAAMTVTPVISVDLGYYGQAMGSAQLLSDGTYFFVPTLVALGPSNIKSFDEEILPTPGKLTGTQVLNIQAPEVYRSWQIPDLYTPPIT